MKKVIHLVLIVAIGSCKSEVNTSATIETTEMVVHGGDDLSVALALGNMKDLSESFMSYPIKFPDNVSMSEYGKDQEAFNSFQTLNNLLREESLTLDQKVKSYLEENKDKYYHFHLTQWAALVMIDQKLLKLDKSQEQQEQLAFYTQLLLDYEYHHPEVVEKALVALQGYWSNEKIKDAANKFLENVDQSKTASGRGNLLRELLKS